MLVWLTMAGILVIDRLIKIAVMDNFVLHETKEVITPDIPPDPGFESGGGFWLNGRMDLDFYHHSAPGFVWNNLCPVAVWDQE